MSPDSVVLEIARLSTPVADVPQLETLWAEVDELRGDPVQRELLNAHGWRWGVIGQRLPAAIPALIARQADMVESGDAIRLQSRRLQSRTDRPALEPVGGKRPRVDVMLLDGDGLRGETFVDAQCAFQLRTRATSDGSVAVELIPVLQYGELKNRRIVQDGLWRFSLLPDERRWPEFTINEVLQPGQTLIVGAGPDARGAGGQFFAHPDGQGRREILLLRLAQTQQDNLFTSKSRP